MSSDPIPEWELELLTINAHQLSKKLGMPRSYRHIKRTIEVEATEGTLDRIAELYGAEAPDVLRILRTRRELRERQLTAKNS